MSYPVYLAISVGAPMDHHAIFIETDSDLHTGYIYHVTGNIAQGMSYGHEKGKPEDSNTFLPKSHIGFVLEAESPRVQSVVNKVEAPAKQFKGPRRIDPNRPPRRCQEWTREAIRALKDEGILREGGGEGSGE